VQNVGTIAELVAEGVGISFVPETLALTRGVRAIAVPSAALERRIRVVWRAEKPVAPCVRAFLKLAREHFDRVGTVPREPWVGTA
jgi:DNA-binding transcriptional LysR family regulator